MGTRIDLSGERFGQLIVVREGVRNDGGVLFWECRCDCGTSAQVRGDRLRSGNTKSCGCLKSAQRRPGRKTHGLTGTRTYRIWAQMKNRCLKPSNKDFKHYGGRGVTVCDRWHRFENFLHDMGESPAGLTLDRHPNSNGNYEPGNCRWTTMKEQNRNRRYHVMVTHEGKTQCVSAWAEELGVNEPMLRIYLKKHISLVDAVAALQRHVTRFSSSGRQKENSSGYPGVKKSLNKWIARVVVDGKRKSLGTFETAEAAAEAYRTIKKSLNKSAGV